jgi:thiol peroxidase
MQECTGVHTFKGDPVTLLGAEVKVGDAAKDFGLVGDFPEIKTLADYKGKVKILTVNPSLDTGVCDTVGQRFNTEAAALGDDVAVLVISKDLPFAQARWCGAVGADNVSTLSAYQNHDFGTDYGILVKDWHLLARSVFVVDKDNKVTYTQLVPEWIDEPDYDAALAAARAAV